MTPINRCIDCGKSLSGKSKRCTCGWIIVDEESEPVNDYRCHYVLLGKRCDKEGTICNSTRGHEWYCAAHWYYGNRV